MVRLPGEDAYRSLDGGEGVAVSLCGPRAGKRAACLSICAHVHLIALFCRNYLWHPWVQISSVLYPHQRKIEKKNLLVFCWNRAGYLPGYVSPCLLHWWLRSQPSVSTHLHACKLQNVAYVSLSPSSTLFIGLCLFLSPL